MTDHEDKLQQLFFGHVGATLLYCQLLESSINDLNNWPALVEAGYSNDELLKFDSKKNQTLHPAISRLRKLLGISNTFLRHLDGIRKKRNNFVHSYIEEKELFLEDPEKLFTYIEELGIFISELNETLAIFHAFQRNYNSKHIPRTLIDAFNADRKDRNVDKRIESWRTEVARLFNVDLPYVG